MNLLAHALLAHISLPDTGGKECTGALMADFFTGMHLQDYPKEIQLGIIQHRAIDEFTDKHTASVLLRKKIASDGAPHFTSSIIADIFFDHILASEWEHFGKPVCNLGIKEFCSIIYSRLEATKQFHTPSFKTMYEWLINNSWLSAYANIDTIHETLTGLSKKMSGKPNLVQSLSVLNTDRSYISELFAFFWPELINFAINFDIK